MIDVKKMMYRYYTYVEGERNAIRSRDRVNAARSYPSCIASYSGEIMGRGGIPSSSTERFALANAEAEQKEGADHYETLARAYREVIEVIEGAVNTLDKIQQELIREKYFNGRDVEMTANMIGVGIRAFWTHHKNAMESLETCLNGGDIFFTKASLVPQKNRRNAVKYAVNRVSQDLKTVV